MNNCFAFLHVLFVIIPEECAFPIVTTKAGILYHTILFYVRLNFNQAILFANVLLIATNVRSIPYANRNTIAIATPAVP